MTDADQVEVQTLDAVRANRLVHANLTGDSGEIVRIMNEVIAEGDRSLSRLVMVLAANLSLHMQNDVPKKQAIYQNDLILAALLRHGD